VGCVYDFERGNWITQTHPIPPLLISALGAWTNFLELATAFVSKRIQIPGLVRNWTWLVLHLNEKGDRAEQLDKETTGRFDSLHGPWVWSNIPVVAIQLPLLHYLLGFLRPGVCFDFVHCACWTLRASMIPLSPFIILFRVSSARARDFHCAIPRKSSWLQPLS
jgi:hypothetical protein